MNITKAQKDIFKHLLNGSNSAKFDFDKDSIFITPNGYYGFVLPKVSLQINADRIREIKKIDLTEIVKEEYKYKLTDECKIILRPSKVYAVKLESDENERFVNEKYLECFQNPRFYSKDISLVVVTEPTAKGEEKIVGLICPIRV